MPIETYHRRHTTRSAPPVILVLLRSATSIFQLDICRTHNVNFYASSIRISTASKPSLYSIIVVQDTLSPLSAPGFRPALFEDHFYVSKGILEPPPE